MDLAELLALLARWNELTDAERVTLNEGLNLAERTDAELAQIEAALLETAETILAGDQDDDSLEALEWIATTNDLLHAETEAREDAATERTERAQALSERIRGNASDGDGEGGDGDGDAGAGDADGAGDESGDAGDGGDGGAGDGEDDASDGDGENAEQPQAVAAAGTRVSRVNARRPRAVQPRTPAVQRSALVASANVPGVQMGARLEGDRLARAFRDTIEAMQGGVVAAGVRVPVAHAAVQDWGDDRYLTGDPRGNLRKIEGVTQPQAIAAAGGICAPAVPRYDLPMVATSGRPVRDGLVRFGADRGGVILPQVPLLTDLDGSSAVWTVANDVAAVTDTNVRKPCLRVECGDTDTVVPVAIPTCLEFGNWNARTWPERVDRFVALSMAAQARLAESRMLTRIGALSTQVTVPQLLGSARDVLTTIDLATAAMRNRHRMLPNEPLRFMAPAWLRNQMRSDLTREMPGAADERLALADAEIDAFFAVRNVNVSWFLDGEAGQVFGSQADGDLLGWHSTTVTYLFPEGSFLFLDGGELNLGVVRDTTTNARNDFQMFSEVFEEVAFYGVESLRIAMTLCPTGATSGSVEPVCADSGVS